MTRLGVRVIKLGGSLLDWPEWPGQLRRWLASQEPAANVVVAGGGVLVERIRELDRIHGFSAEAAHWLAIRAMGITSRLSAELLPEAKLVCWKKGTGVFFGGENRSDPFFVLDVEGFLREENDAADALPASWDVTSDSIAARVASALDADELVLLKSSLPVDGATCETLANCGYVDAYFPLAARGLRVRCVNLRDADQSAIALKEARID